jgi:mRNA interferase RelE/StbE
MNYKLEVTRRAEKDLRQIHEKDALRIYKAIMALKAGLTGDVKKLVNHEPEYRLRVGEWRVLFDVEADTIVIGRILDRKEAYRG